MEHPKWKQVGSTPYEVSSTGAVRRNGRTLTPVKDGGGYLIVKLHGGARPKIEKIHRLVAKAFLPNPEDKPYVNHIDGDRTHNSLANLEWATPAENRAKLTKPWRQERGRPIIQLSSEGAEVRRWSSIKEASEALGTPTSNIGGACRSPTRTAAGYRWTYAEPVQEPEEWKTIVYKGAEYEVSDLGRVKTRYGPSYGSLQGKYCVFRGELVHRLVATAFVPQIDEFRSVVNHVDANGQNNRAANLEWATPSENSLHGYRVGAGKRLCKPVRQWLPDGTTVDYVSAVEASRVTRIGPTSICRACKGSANTAGGFRWTFVLDGAPGGGAVTEPLKTAPAPKISDEDPIWAELGL